MAKFNPSENNIVDPFTYIEQEDQKLFNVIDEHGMGHRLNKAMIEYITNFLNYKP